jgi:hypothetical protein
MRFSRAHRAIYLFETNNNGGVSNCHHIEQQSPPSDGVGTISRFMKNEMVEFLKSFAFHGREANGSGAKMAYFLIYDCEL